MTSATQKPRAGEHVSCELCQQDNHATLDHARDLQAERDSLREREKALIDVLGKLLDVTKRANIEVPMSDAPVFFAARDLLAKHGR